MRGGGEILPSEDSGRTGPAGTALQTSRAGREGRKRTSEFFGMSEYDKKASQMTGFFIMLDFLETVLHYHKFHTMQAWSQHKHEIAFLPQGHHPSS